MKKIAAFFLFACLLAPFAATFTLLKIQKHQLKRSIKHRIIDGIDKNELVLLQFTKKEAEDNLNWEHAKEFEYEGEMYDVVEKKQSKDSVSYWCWWDNKETKLNRQLSEVLLNSWQQNDEQRQRNNRLIQYTKNWFSNDSPPKCAAGNFRVIPSIMPPYLVNHIDFHPGILTPPPKFS